MKEDIRSYAKLGLVHHMLYPKCTCDADFHMDTLIEFSRRKDIETFDCCLPYGDERRERITEELLKCDKQIVYALHLFPSRKISLSSRDIQEQAMTRIIIKDQIDMAVKIGAKGFVFVSGADDPDHREEARAAFKAFCRWFCKELKPYDITALLEPFDRTIDKKYLYGPIDDCIGLMDDLSEEFDNIGIELDMAHLPLMSEEFGSAIARCGRYIKRVHLGNCVKCNVNNPWYGDKHPPMDFEEGEISKKELKIILESLLDIGYLSKEKRGALVMEMQPYPDKTPDYTIKRTMKLLDEAWNEI
ncbi:MAG: TIM barrel protein [Clostridia bacterium]